MNNLIPTTTIPTSLPTSATERTVYTYDSERDLPSSCGCPCHKVNGISAPETDLVASRATLNHLLTDFLHAVSVPWNTGRNCPNPAFSRSILVGMVSDLVETVTIRYRAHVTCEADSAAMVFAVSTMNWMNQLADTEGLLLASGEASEFLTARCQSPAGRIEDFGQHLLSDRTGVGCLLADFAENDGVTLVKPSNQVPTRYARDFEKLLLGLLTGEAE